MITVSDAGDAEKLLAGHPAHSHPRHVTLTHVLLDRLTAQGHIRRTGSAASVGCALGDAESVPAILDSRSRKFKDDQIGCQVLIMH